MQLTATNIALLEASHGAILRLTPLRKSALLQAVLGCEYERSDFWRFSCLSYSTLKEPEMPAKM
jgi:hypothetical protein